MMLSPGPSSFTATVRYANTVNDHKLQTVLYNITLGMYPAVTLSVVFTVIVTHLLSLPHSQANS